MLDEIPMIRETDIVYIAGPMTGMPLFNYPAFFGIAELIKKEYAVEVLNPARQPNGLAYDEYMRRAFDDLDRATVIVLLDGWRQSKGATKEVIRAHQRRIRILYWHQVEIVLTRKLEKENPLIIKKDNTPMKNETANVAVPSIATQAERTKTGGSPEFAVKSEHREDASLKRRNAAN